MEEIKEIKQQLDIIINKVVIIMNYTEKETVSSNANAISNVIPTIHTNLNKIESRLEEINNIRNNIWKSLNMTKDQLELLNIEDTITNLGRLLFILEQFKYLKDISK